MDVVDIFDSISEMWAIDYVHHRGLLTVSETATEGVTVTGLGSSATLNLKEWSIKQ